LKKTTFVTLALTVLAGCASTDDVQVAKREETYTPLGTLVPRKTGQNKDERTYINKEDFKRQQETLPTL
jgi:type IV pilus biogenesis protein CpaD/CtpE